MPVTDAQLRRAARTSAAAHERRDELIRQAIAEGKTLRAVAALVGLSHTRVAQIARG